MHRAFRRVAHPRASRGFSFPSAGTGGRNANIDERRAEKRHDGIFQLTGSSALTIIAGVAGGLEHESFLAVLRSVRWFGS